MTYNEWCEYAQFGQTCEYDNQILQFVEQFVSARHHFYKLCKDEGIQVWEIQRYCEKYG